MCIHHYFHYLACAHEIKNLPLSILSHCPATDKALRHYHDQPAYLPADSQLNIIYNIPVTEQIGCPQPCPEKWPSKSLPTMEQQKANDDQYNAWSNRTYQAFVSNQRKTHPPDKTYAMILQTGYDFDSKKRRSHLKGLYNAETSANQFSRHDPSNLDFTGAPYPEDQLRHLVELPKIQAVNADAPYNVVVHQLPWGCGRSNYYKCMIGHVGVDKLQCPYLLASRAPKDGKALKSHQGSQWLRDFSPEARGGAVNVPQQGQQMEGVRSAIYNIDRRGNKLARLVLNDRYLNDVFSMVRMPPVPLARPDFSDRNHVVAHEFHCSSYHSDVDPRAPNQPQPKFMPRLVNTWFQGVQPGPPIMPAPPMPPQQRPIFFGPGMGYPGPGFQGHPMGGW